MISFGSLKFSHSRGTLARAGCYPTTTTEAGAITTALDSHWLSTLEVGCHC